jgi:hypothetical protein
VAQTDIVNRVAEVDIEIRKEIKYRRSWQLGLNREKAQMGQELDVIETWYGDESLVQKINLKIKYS